MENGGMTGIMFFLKEVTAFFLSAAVLLMIRSSWERRQLRTEHYAVSDKKNGERLRIAFFSDVHNRLEQRSISKIIRLTENEKPDVIILGGDIFTYSHYKSHPEDKLNAFELIKGLSAVSPVFYGEGNHEQKLKIENPGEYAEYVSGCEKAGASFITDGHIIFGQRAFYFVSLEREFYKKRFPCHRDKETLPCDYLIKRLGMPQKSRMNILLMHSPMYLNEAAEWGADLVLSGHFHGGTIRLPLLGGLMTPQLQFFIKECSGAHRCGDAQMIVTRGVGTHSVNLRLNDLPEISIIDITA